MSLPASLLHMRIAKELIDASLKTVQFFGQRLINNKEGMDVFQELRHLYVNVGNDVRNLREMANSPRIGLTHLQADRLCNEPLSDVKLQMEKVKAKIKELQSETHFGEVMTCCFDVVNDSLAQLDQLERHLQKYSVQPIGNARQQCEIEPGMPSKQNELPSAVAIPISTAVSMVTEPCQPRVNAWPATDDIPPTPKLSDFGISESFTQRLDEVTAAVLKRSQMNHAGVGQGQAGIGAFNPTTDPCNDQPSCHSSPTGSDTAAAYRNLPLNVSAIRGRGQNEGDNVSKKSVGSLVKSKTRLNHEQSDLIQSMHGMALNNDDENNFCSTLPFPLHDTALSHTGVGLPGYEAHLEPLSNAKSSLTVLDLPVPSPPQLSDMAKKALEYHAVARGRVSMLAHPVTNEMDSSPSLSTSLLSEQTVNILHQLRLSNISASSIKQEPYSAEKFGENIPPDHPSSWKSSAVNAGHTAAKRCLDLDGGRQRRDAASGQHQNVVSSTEFVPKQHIATGGATTDQISKGSSVKGYPCVSKTSSVLGHGDGTNDRCKKSVEKSSGPRFGSVDWTCPKILPYSLSDYESLVPAAVKNIVTFERINECIDKANDVLLNKMLDGSLMTLSVDDLKCAFGSNASLFLKLMAKTGKLSEKTGECGVAEYSLI